MISPFSAKKPRIGFLSQRVSGGGDGSPRAQILLRRAAMAVSVVFFAFLITRMPARDSMASDVDIERQIVATERYQAAFFFESVDLEKTEQERAAAAAKVPYVYRVRRDAVREQVAAVDAQVAAIRAHRLPVEQAVIAALRGSTSAESPRDIITRAVAAYVAGLDSAKFADSPAMLALWLTPSENSLPERVFEEPKTHKESESGTVVPLPTVALVPAEPAPLNFALGDTLARMAHDDLEFILGQGVRESALAPDLAERRCVILREDLTGAQNLGGEEVLGNVPDPVRAVDLLRARLENTAKLFGREVNDPQFDWGKLSDAAMAVVKPALAPTISFDEAATRQARQQAENAVEPVMREIQAHEVIQDEGERWTAQSRSDVRTYIEKLNAFQKPSNYAYAPLVAHMALAALALAGLRRTLTLFGPKTGDERDKFLYLALLLIGATLVLGRVVAYFEMSGLLVPIAATAILYAILVNIRLAAVFALVNAGLLSAQYGYDWRVVVLGVTMSLAGVFGIFKVRRRSDMTAATLKATAAGLVVVAALVLARESVFSEAALRQLGLILLNGAVCLFVIPGILSPLERLFGITTDIQLLEYSDLNNEVLSRLAMEVPATWAHSLMMGQLAESAAEAIGANGLLARVCAYYHDIGKIRRPEYFTENQKGYNIHDDLTPRLSARAIAAHVLYGLDLAREAHLPKPIVDGIVEHHGTTRIGFFYQQAVQQQKHGDIREEDFRYPGPKPQRRETAILMICDAVESGVRSIKNPNEERVREFIDKIIAARAADRQFDECDLTMRDLDTIAALLTRRVLSASHTRIAYPEMKKEEINPNVIPMPGGNR